MKAVASLKVRQAAKALGISVNTVRRWADAGILQSTKTSGGHRRFDTEYIKRVAKEIRPGIDLDKCSTPDGLEF